MKDLEKIITKELLRRVLPKEIENLSNNFSFYIDEDNIVFNDDGEMQFEYCIYKFAFKCKEWALIRGYSLLSGRPIVRDEEGTQVFNYWYNCYIWEIDENSIDSPTQNTKIETNSETEPEAIIKACEWILKEQNNDTK